MGKKSKNGFWYFMQEYRAREESLGRRFQSLTQVQADPKCSAEWNALSPAEKSRYNHSAKDEKLQAKKQTGLGESVALLEEAKVQKEQYEHEMKRIINECVKQAELMGTLCDQKFHLIHVNHFYTKVDLDGTVEYIPAEFAVVEFSLLDGVRKIFHQILRVQVEKGYDWECRTHAEATHKLSPNLPDAGDDYQAMFDRLVAFLKPKANSKARLAPLYTVKKFSNVVSSLLRRLTEAVGEEPHLFDVYSLEYLLGAVMKCLNEKIPHSANTIGVAEAQLGKEAFIWAPDIECSYHLKVDGTGPHCSQSIVTQWVYVFCDYCCSILKIEMIPGQHCPSNNLCAGDWNTVISGMKSINLQQPTGAAEYSGGTGGHRGRTKDDQERRKKAAADSGSLTIIDHSRLPPRLPNVNPSATQESAPWQLRASKNATPWSVDAKPSVDTEDFPALGPLRRPRSKKTEEEPASHW